MKADKACIDVAAGRAPADLVFKNVNVVNVFSEEIITADVAVAGGVIAGVGSYRGRTELDCTDKFLCPGFIDAHIHIESSLAAPFEFARAATRSGTTTIVADPHEIVNVCGAQAVQYLLDATENLPLNVYLMLPSSVPATPFETNGADFTAADMAPFMAHPRVLGLGEVMCYPDVLAARQTVLEKLALAADAGKRADGHAPGLSGRELQAYAAAGIRTEHECTTFAEAAEKLRAGLAVLVREGSAAKNLSVLVNGLLDSDLPADRFLFCTDDKHLDDIARDGHLRWNVRQAISLGMKPVTAIKMATWNAAREYGLRDLGAVAAGYRADLVLLDSLKQMTVRAVYKDGRPVEERFAGLAAAPVPDALLHSVHFENVAPADLALPVAGPAHVIEMVPYQIVTRHAVEEVPSENGFFRPNAVYTKLCVVERHGKNGGVAVCPVKGYGITGGARQPQRHRGGRQRRGPRAGHQPFERNRRRICAGRRRKNTGRAAPARGRPDEHRPVGGDTGRSGRHSGAGKGHGYPVPCGPVYQPFLSGAARYTGIAPDGPRPVRRNCIFPGKGLIGYE